MLREELKKRALPPLPETREETVKIITTRLFG